MDIKKNLVEYEYKSLNTNKYKEYLEEDKKHKKQIQNKVKKTREKIHSEIFKLININMENIENKLNSNNMNSDELLNINTSSSIDKEVFQNYSGEKISIITYSNSNAQTIEKNDKNNNENSYQINEKEKNINNNRNSNDSNKINKKKSKKPLNIKNSNLPEVILNININRFETKTSQETLINNSDVEIINESSLKIEKNNSKEENEKESILTERKIENKVRNIFLYDNTFKSPKPTHKNLSDYNKSKSNFKDNRKYLFSSNFSLFDSTSTSNTYEKCKKKFKFHQYADEICHTNIYLKYNKTELINFFTEINLPKIYADKFIENGFDDLDVILTLTKTSITITNQNLKDIGIKNAGHRAQILIHLEEKADVFPFYLEKNIIYNNYNINYLKNDSLFKFLSSIGCEKYVNNFRRNGYYNSELLFSQMLTRESITKQMIKDDFFIENEYNIGKIIKGLNVESKNYIKKLKRINKNINVIFDDRMYHNSCESCIIS